MPRVCKPSRDKPMSYILDALKRSEAERSRGAVPGLHARQVSSPPPQAERDMTGRWRWLGAAALVLAGLAAGLWAWRAPSSDSGRTSVVSTTTVAASTAPAVVTPDAFVVALRAASAAQRPGPVAPIIVPKPVLVTPTAVAKAPPAQAAPANAPLLGELSEDLRRQIPALAITGVVYSENPGQRLLLVNNQVLTQGSVVAPELTLEEIQLKSSVLAFRGTRFRVAH